MTEGNGEVREIPDSVRQGELPPNWIICSLDDLLERISNGASVTQYDDKVGFPITRIETIWNEEIDSSRVKYIYESDEKFIYKYALKYGDILLSHINSDSHLGKTALYKNKPRILIHGINLLLLRVSKLILPEYLKYQLKHLRAKGAFIKVAQRAVNQSSINQNKLKSFSIKLCSLNEQHCIVNRIEELFSDLDQGIENLKKAQKQLKVYRQVVLKWAFEGKLTEKWRSQIQPEKLDIKTGEELLAQIKAERENRYQQQLAEWEEALREWEAIGKSRKKPTKPSKPKDTLSLTQVELTKLSQLPDSWCWARVDQLGNVQLGRQRSPQNRSKDFPTQYIRAANITENGLDLTDVMDMEFKPHEFEQYQLKYGDIVLSEASGSAEQVGKPALWRNQIPNCCFQNTVVRFKSICLSSEYFLVVFKNFYINGVFSKVSTGVGINHLSANKFSAIPVPLPPVEEQEQILQEIESRLSICDQLEATIIENLQKAEALRQSILKQAFEGKLVPQDPNDEPAEKLLERIKQEKIKVKKDEQLSIQGV